jgi:tetratricopeptide (TPR) repeat protein
MGLNSNPNKPMTLSLEPIEGDAPEPAQGTAKASEPEASLPAPEKKLVDQAAQEFDNGSINHALWLRVLAKAAGDKTSAKTAYLRARARELEHAARTGGTMGPVLVAREASKPAAGSAAAKSGMRAPEGSEPAAPARAQPKRALVIGAAATLVVLGVAVVGWAAMRRDGGEPPNPAIAATAPAQAPSAQLVAEAPATPAEKATLHEDFGARCEELVASGNWNVLVIYASEWTRKEPANANAWVQLSVGYAKLHQLNDAFQAATKATNLASQNALVWRNLGQLHVALKEPSSALAAFEQATALNDKDAYSFAQAGKLDVQLDRLPQAKIAFDSALAASADNVDALCGEMMVAQKLGRPKDAEEMAARLSTLAATCQFSTDQGATVVVKRPMPDKVVRAGGR